MKVRNFLAAICLFFLLYWISFTIICNHLFTDSTVDGCMAFDKLFFVSTFIFSTFFHFHLFPIPKY